MIVAPSILASDFSSLEEEVSKMERAGAQYIHLDIMDGLFVKNTTFGPELLSRIVPSSGKMVKDTHLMVADPLVQIPLFAAAGSDLITVHYEALFNDEERRDAIKMIHGLGKKAGMSVKPNTPIEVLDSFLDGLDLVLVMSVEPGEGGQEFLPSALKKIEYLASREGRRYEIEVDGGINQETGRACAEAGATILVAGSYLYGHSDYKERVQKLLKL